MRERANWVVEVMKVHDQVLHAISLHPYKAIVNLQFFMCQFFLHSIL